MKTILKNLQKTIDKQNEKCYNNYRKKEKITKWDWQQFPKKNKKKTLDKIIKKGYNNNVRKKQKPNRQNKKNKKSAWQTLQKML